MYDFFVEFLFILHDVIIYPLFDALTYYFQENFFLYEDLSADTWGLIYFLSVLFCLVIVPILIKYFVRLVSWVFDVVTMGVFR